MKKIVFLVDYNGNKPEYKNKLAGDVMDSTTSDASYLIRNGIAELHTEVKEVIDTKEEKETHETKEEKLQGKELKIK